MTFKIALNLILAQSSILRFWHLESIPPQTENTLLEGRLLSAATGVLMTLVVFYFSRMLRINRKPSLLAAWVYSIIPQAIEQGRIYSPIQLLTFLLFLSGIIITKYFLKKNNTKLYFTLATLVFSVIPLYWWIKYPPLLPVDSILNNLFILLSPDLLFYRNITFWWGGLREFGIMYLFFLPFIILGLLKAFPGKRFLLFILLWILVFSAFSPAFPESREIFLAVPLWSVLTGTGLFYSFQARNIYVKTVATGSTLFLLYEYSQLIHYYFRHYPLIISGNLDKIHGAF